MLPNFTSMLGKINNSQDLVEDLPMLNLILVMEHLEASPISKKKMIHLDFPKAKQLYLKLSSLQKKISQPKLLIKTQELKFNQMESLN